VVCVNLLKTNYTPYRLQFVNERHVITSESLFYVSL